MLLESIKDITKDGRIVVKDADYSGRTLYVFKLGSTFKGKLHNDRTVFPVVNLPTKEEINKWAKENNFAEVRFMDSKDSQYTKFEYQAKLTSLNNQLSQAKQLGDSEEAKELQKEIDELKALESGVQDKDFKQAFRYSGVFNIYEYDNGQVIVNTPALNGKVEFNSVAEAKKAIDNKDPRVMALVKDSDTEAKITDLTEKAKQARAQGYAADQYEVEIEKLKAKDKKTKDTPRDNIERQIDKLEDQLEKATGAEKVRIQAEIDNLEEDLEYNQDSKDILTQDPNK